MKIRASVIIAIFFFIFQLFIDGILPKLGFSTHELYKAIAILPSGFWAGEQFFAPLSWVLLHDNWPALFFFLFAMLTIGRSLEQELGHLKFCLLLFIPGFLSAIPVLAFMKESYVIVTGSFALYWSLFTVCLVFFPKSKIQFIFLKMPLWLFSVILLCIHFVSFIFSSLEGGAWLVMPGGMFFGIVYAWLGLGLQSGRSLREDVNIFYLDLFSRKYKPKSVDYLKTLQSQKKVENHKISSQSKDLNSGNTNKSQNKSGNASIESENDADNKLKQAGMNNPVATPSVSKKEMIQKQIVEFEPKDSSPKSQKDSDSPEPTNKKLLLDPKTGEFYFKD